MTDIILLDGAIGQELVRRTRDRKTPLWSTQVMIDHPDLVRAVHDDYFSAGATIATANTYAVLPDRLDRVGLADKVPDLVATALGAAHAARDAHGSGRVAASLGPLMATYRPDLCPPPAEAARLYSDAVDLRAPNADLLIFETMSSLDQAEGALLAAKDTDVPVWLAVSVDDRDGTRLRSGEAVADLAPLIDRYGPDAVLINCAPPEVIASGLDIIKNFGRPYGAYANGFTEISQGFLADFPTVDALERRTDLSVQAYADIALSWVEQGATIIGGCCEIGPGHIAELHRRLIAAGHRIH
ncbi:MAG: homocysteine S-methyltransferase family protein [Marinibacterium sp.]